MKEFILDELQDFAVEMDEKYPNMNFGGCCVFASLFAKRMIDLIPTIKIVVEDRVTGNSCSIDDVRNNIENNTVNDWYDNGIDFTHVLIQFEYQGEIFWYDANGIHTDMVEFELVDGYLGILEALELVNDNEGWNPSFNRKDIPNIKRDIYNFHRRFKRSLDKSIKR